VPTITNVPAPATPPIPTDLIPAELLDRIIQFGFAGQPGAQTAVPCRWQGSYTFGGETTQYPHVNER
jgi:hypothetical protein